MTTDIEFAGSIDIAANTADMTIKTRIGCSDYTVNYKFGKRSRQLKRTMYIDGKKLSKLDCDMEFFRDYQRHEYSGPLAKVHYRATEAEGLIKRLFWHGVDTIEELKNAGFEIIG